MDIQKGLMAASTEAFTPNSSRDFHTSSRGLRPNHTLSPEARDATAERHSSEMALHKVSIVPLDHEEDLRVLDRADPMDDMSPQNWSARKKSLLFLALMSSSILCDG